MTKNDYITSPEDSRLDELCRELVLGADAIDIIGEWPAQQLALCGRYGVHRWFVAQEHGGLGWSEVDILRAYVRISGACLTTAFILTQRNGALRRIAECDNADLKQRLLPGLLSGETYSTIALSHLTTSRRHLGKPAMAARETAGGFILDGFSAWVTGGCHAETIVVGAELDDHRQVMLALPTDLSGVSTPPPIRLTALSASHTGELRCNDVAVNRQWLVAGPAENVMASAAGAKTGGLQTSALAIGLAGAAVDFLKREALRRPELAGPAGNFQTEQLALQADLSGLARGQSACTADDLRGRANGLVLRTTQASLAAAKGAGYVLGHPAGRWCREGVVLPRLELPATSDVGDIVPIGRFRILIHHGDTEKH